MINIDWITSVRTVLGWKLGLGTLDEAGLLVLKWKWKEFDCLLVKMNVWLCVDIGWNCWMLEMGYGMLFVYGTKYWYWYPTHFPTNEMRRTYIKRLACFAYCVLPCHSRCRVTKYTGTYTTSLGPVHKRGTSYTFVWSAVLMAGLATQYNASNASVS